MGAKIGGKLRELGRVGAGGIEPCFQLTQEHDGGVLGIFVFLCLSNEFFHFCGYLSCLFFCCGENGNEQADLDTVKEIKPKCVVLSHS